MTHKQIRKAFIEYFKQHQHEYLSSSSLVPHNDPTLLFTNAGMNQFKDVFLGNEKLNSHRAVTIQKCVRAGGKHNDLENVGYTTRHHTFFEMLGNFSFGDYFKKEALRFAWSFLTEELKIPKEKLHVTVYEKDDETADLWHTQEGVPKDRILRFGEADNFWRMGETGPCGPCSEIFYDHGPDAAKDPSLPFGHDEDRYVEVWNLVFMQYFEDENKKLTPLPKPSVDTGAGLERLAAVLQGQADNYYTDLFLPLIKKACDISKIDFDQWDQPETKATLKVLSDHARSTMFLMADGVFPGSDGRAYVLRRIMRRAIRYGRKISSDNDLFAQLCLQVIEDMKELYPALDISFIDAVRAETKKFSETLSQGTQLLEEHIAQVKKSGQSLLPGPIAFKLYDTFGFPIDLTELVAREHSIQIDLPGFEKCMQTAKEIAKKARKSHAMTANDKFLSEWASQLKPTDFLGYEVFSQTASVLATTNGEESKNKLGPGAGILVVDKTPFYAEGGGQIGDCGEFQSTHGSGKILDCQKRGDVFIHFVEIEKGQISVGDKVELQVTASARRDTARNHSATHILHQALRGELGEQVAQAGSLVTTDKLRFDFNHNTAVTREQLQKIEANVNEQIRAHLEVTSKTTSHQQAIDDGAIAMFGEKYGDKVRVVSLGNYSKELCGGTHVQNTSDIGIFKIVSEASVSSGVRRIEALTGRMAFEFLNKNYQENTTARQQVGLPIQWDKYMQMDSKTVLQSIEQQQATIQQLKKEIQKAQSKSIDAASLVQQAKSVKSSNGDLLLLITEVAIEDRKALSDVMDQLRSRSQNLVAVLIGQGSPRPVLTGANKALKNVHCGNIVKALGQAFDGKGGGRPDFAQGSINSFDSVEAEKIISALL